MNKLSTKTKIIIAVIFLGIISILILIYNNKSNGNIKIVDNEYDQITKKYDESNEIENNKNGNVSNIDNNLNNEKADNIIYVISPEKRECLVADDKYFYEEIEGFEFEEGYKYVVEVKKKENGKISLVKIIKKENAKSDIVKRIITISSNSFKCGFENKKECLIVDGKKFYGNIVGFSYKKGYKYVLEIEENKKNITDKNNHAMKLIKVVSKEAHVKDSKKYTVKINSKFVKCNDNVRNDCIIINDDVVINKDQIIGFNFKEGNEYFLEIEEKSTEGGEKIRNLVKVVSMKKQKEKEKFDIEIFKIDSKKVGCGLIDGRKCYKVNGKFFYDEIEGFEYEEGYNYIIEVKRVKTKKGEKRLVSGKRAIYIRTIKKEKDQ